MKGNAKINLFGIISLFVTCYFMRLFDFPIEFTVIVGGVFCLLLVIGQKKIRVNVGICLLCLTMTSYYVIGNGIEGLFYAILYIPLIIYVLGNYLIFESSDFQKREEKLYFLIMIMVVGYTVLGVLNSYMYFAGYVIPGTRRWQDFWSHEIVPGTQHSAYFLPTLAMFFPAVMYFKKRKVINVVVFILTSFFCYTALVTKSRMQLVIFVLVFCAQMMSFILLEKEKAKKVLSNRTTWIAILSGIILLLTLFFVVKDTEVIAEFIENLGDDGGIFKNARFAGQRLALKQLFVYPMGGMQMDFGALDNFCHNTWLDMANISGIVPFFAFVAYTAYTLYELLRLLCIKKAVAEVKIIVIGLYAAFFLYMTVEPALMASVHLVSPWIWLHGLVHGYIESMK